MPMLKYSMRDQIWRKLKLKVNVVFFKVLNHSSKYWIMAIKFLFKDVSQVLHFGFWRVPQEKTRKQIVGNLGLRMGLRMDLAKVLPVYMLINKT